MIHVRDCLSLWCLVYQLWFKLPWSYYYLPKVSRRGGGTSSTAVGPSSAAATLNDHKLSQFEEECRAQRWSGKDVERGGNTTVIFLSRWGGRPSSTAARAGSAAVVRYAEQPRAEGLDSYVAFFRVFVQTADRARVHIRVVV